MIEIISDRHKETITECRMEFDLLSDSSAGLSFDYDEKNKSVILANDAQKENYDYAVSHPDVYSQGTIRKFKHSYTVPAKAKCHCGSIIELTDEYMGACECPNCGQWYNLFGQELKSPSEWNDDY